jgi:putative acetyltransferase
MIVRRETEADVDAIRAVTVAAFATVERPLPIEAELVDELRACPGWLPALSLVAVEGSSTAPGAPQRSLRSEERTSGAGTAGTVLGHVVCTRAHVGQAPVLGLGPLSVRPDRQRQGIGSALMHAVLGAADALDEALVVLLGHLDYYPRFGFRPAAEFGITPPSPWGAHFMARPLTTYTPQLRGAFRYAEPFERIP